MRKNLIFSIATVAFLCSCAEEDGTVSYLSREEGHTIRLLAGFGAGTRTVLNNDNTVYWCANDKILVNGTASDDAKHTTTPFAALTGTETASSVWFTASGASAAPYYCLYPSRPFGMAADAVYTSGTHSYSITFPAEQPYENNNTFKSGYNPSVAYTVNGSGTTNFYNLCGIVKVNVTGNWVNWVKKIRLQLADDDPKDIAGTADIVINPNTATPWPTSAITVTGTKIVDVTFSPFASLDPTTPTSIYFVLPPGEYKEGWQIQIYNDDYTSTIAGDYPDGVDDMIRKPKVATGKLKVVRGAITAVNVDLGVYFAGSNIYYDGTQLTFDEIANASTSQYYQGVFFRYGSLIAIDPTRETSGGVSFVANATKIYKPTNHIPGSASWQFDTAANLGYTSIIDIPFYDKVNYPVSYIGDRTTPFLDEQWNDVAPLGGYRGDICKWLTVNGNAPGYNSVNPALSTKWRMPVTAEFGTVPPPYSGEIVLEHGTTGGAWPDETNTTTFTNAISGPNIEYGIYPIDHGVKKTSVHPQPFFPASGRHVGSCYAVGLQGIYSPSAFVDTWGARYFHFRDYDYEYNFSVTLLPTSCYMYSVRCVRDI